VIFAKKVEDGLNQHLAYCKNSTANKLYFLS